jgi:hypothetical protein
MKSVFAATFTLYFDPIAGPVKAACRTLRSRTPTRQIAFTRMPAKLNGPPLITLTVRSNSDQERRFHPDASVDNQSRREASAS